MTDENKTDQLPRLPAWRARVRPTLALRIGAGVCLFVIVMGTILTLAGSLAQSGEGPRDAPAAMPDAMPDAGAGLALAGDEIPDLHW